jgi:hypothetical protein
MPSGKGFPKEQNDWIVNHIPTYLLKTIPGKPHIPGVTPPTEDADLKESVHARCHKFEVEIKELRG